MELDTIICGDCFEAMRGMEDNSVDLILTDPPYGLGIADWDTEIDIAAFTAEAYRLLKPFGFYAYFCQMPTMLSWAHETQKRFLYKEHISWIKRIPVPSFRLSRSHESILIWSKGNAHFFQTKGKYSDVKVPGVMFDMVSIASIQRHISELQRETRTGIAHRSGRGKHHPVYSRFTSVANRAPENVNYTNVWSFVPHNSKTFGNGGKEHPTTKPLEVMERLITMLSAESAVVFDPCIGSGTTAVAAIRTGRRYIGIELDEGYCDLARERIRIEQAQLKLF